MRVRVRVGNTLLLAVTLRTLRPIAFAVGRLSNGARRGWYLGTGCCEGWEHVLLCSGAAQNEIAGGVFPSFRGVSPLFRAAPSPKSAAMGHFSKAALQGFNRLHFNQLGQKRP